MKKKIFIFLILIILIFTLTSCNEKDKAPYVKAYGFNAMGSVIQLQLYDETKKDKEEEAFLKVEDIFMLYGQLTSNYNRNEVSEDSPYYDYNNIYLINEQAGKEAVVVKEELIEILNLSIELHKTTNGYFNIGLGNIAKEWKSVISSHLILSLEDYNITLNKVKELGTPDLDKLIIDEVNSTVYLADASINLDLGAIAKGYATELAYNYLKEEMGLTRFKINSGSSSIAIALPPIDYPIKTYIGDDNSTYNNNFYKDGVLGYLPGGNKHIATSGSETQGINVYDGNDFYTKLHHIISPFTLEAVNNYFKVTLVGQNNALLDVYATAVFLMEKEDAVSFLETHEIGYVLYLTEDYSILTNLSSEEFVKHEIVGEL